MKDINQILLTTSIATIGMISYIIYENNKLTVSEIEINSSKVPNGFSGFRILHLTDLHCKVFGENNEGLIKKIKELNPNIIVATGDMISVTKDKNKVFLKLCKSLRHWFPLYYSLGNHEEIIRSSENIEDVEWFNEYINELKNNGIIFLDNEKVSLVKNNSKINLYGLSLPMKYYRRRFTKNRNLKIELRPNDIESLIGQPKKDEFNILLAHNPLNFDSYVRWGSNLTFSGHIHGGIIRLPIIKGILSPEVAFFPKFKEGVYKDRNSSMIVGRGLGNSSLKLRVFNSPEIILVTIR